MLTEVSVPGIRNERGKLPGAGKPLPAEFSGGGALSAGGTVLVAVEPVQAPSEAAKRTKPSATAASFLISLSDLANRPALWSAAEPAFTK
jgi:hypothetical protein